MNITTEMVTSVVSSFAALFSAIWAWSSSRISKRMLRLAEYDASDKKEAVSSYLINSMRWKDSEGGEYASFACSFTNGSMAPSTIHRMDLIIHAFDLSGRGCKTLISPVSKMPAAAEFELLNLPLNLSPKTTISGWLTFMVEYSRFNGQIIDRYEVSGVMSSGQRVGVSCHILMDTSSP